MRILNFRNIRKRWFFKVINGYLTRLQAADEHVVIFLAETHASDRNLRVNDLFWFIRIINVENSSITATDELMVRLNKIWVLRFNCLLSVEKNFLVDGAAITDKESPRCSIRFRLEYNLCNRALHDLRVLENRHHSEALRLGLIQVKLSREVLLVDVLSIVGYKIWIQLINVAFDGINIGHLAFHLFPLCSQASNRFRVLRLLTII